MHRQLVKVIVYSAGMEERLDTAIEVIDGILDQRIQEITDNQFDNIVDALEDEDEWPDPEDP
jgi:predicted methyltransferase